MKIKKIEIKKNKLDINFKFYLFLKELNAKPLKISKSEINIFLESYFANAGLSWEKLLAIFNNIVSNFKLTSKKASLESLLLEITNETELYVFIFSLKLIQIKPLLLEEAKIADFSELSDLKNINQLSVKFDTISKSRPYLKRVNGALLSLLFFQKLEENDTNFISELSDIYITSLFREFNNLKKSGLEANQIFMLMFSESINQSIVADAGISYEDRIYNVLIGLGLKSDAITRKMHDKFDASTEFDFFFTLNNKTFGIGAKRTLRERYKQFVKTAKMTHIDVMIQITLGLDLTEEKAKAIRNHDVILFVADEIYQSKNYLQQISGIYSASELTIDLLKKLSK